MLLAAGGGTVAGALIGTGVGWAAGVSTAEATVAGVTAAGALETANAACGGDMCASEAQDAAKAAQEVAPALEEAVPKAAEATDKVVTVLGRWDANKKLAEQIGGNWLNTNMKIWKELGPEGGWERNKQWLQEAIIRGDTFRLASPISDATAGSGYAKELDYMFNVAGYNITANGQYLYKVVEQVNKQ